MRLQFAIQGKDFARVQAGENFSTVTAARGMRTYTYIIIGSTIYQPCCHNLMTQVAATFFCVGLHLHHRP